MARAILKTAFVNNIGPANAGKHADGGGLWLVVKPDGRSSWVLRWQRGGVRREMGLGSLADVTLAEARRAAEDHRRVLAAGRDPLDERNAQRRAAAIDRARAVTFRQAAETFIAARGTPGNAKHNAQWTSTLETYAFPTLGHLAVADVDRAGVLRVLEPIWATKHETARRVRQRIEAVLDAAHARGQRGETNPARWLALKPVLGARRPAAVEHHPALPWRDVPAFMRTLKQQPGFGARALELTILTACRSGEVLGARWDEVDGDTWTIPAERTKTRRAHRVPLSKPAQEILKDLRRVARPPFVFAGARDGKPLSGMAMLMTLRRMERDDVTVHGFRSSFRDWCADKGKPRELAEAALAHVVDGVEGAYFRSDVFEARRALMAEWAAFCHGR